MKTAIPKLLRSFALEGPIRAVAFFPDGKRIITGGHKDNSARIWDLGLNTTGKQDKKKLLGPLRLEGHSRPVACVAVATSRGGNDVVTAGDDGNILLWTKVAETVGKGKPKPKSLFSSSETEVLSSLALNTTRKLPTAVACGYNNGLLGIWKLNPDADPTRIWKNTFANATIASVHFADDLELLAIIYKDRKIRIFNIRSEVQIAEFNRKDGTVFAFAWIPTTKFFISAVHNTMYVRNAESSETPPAIINGHTQAIKCIAAHPSGRYFASGGDDKELRVWDASTYVQIGSSPPHPGAITHISFSPDGRWIISICQAKTAFLWDAHEFGFEERYRKPHSSSFTGSDATGSGASPGPDPLAKYFDRYPWFAYDTDKAPTSEFYRLCEAAYEDFKVALIQQFNFMYGTDEESLSSWQSLCAKLGIDPIPDCIKECRKIVCTTHVNLVDLVHRKDKAKIFPNVEKLSHYSNITGKIFPREEAYAGGVLRYLLRRISNPSMDRTRGTKSDSKGQASRKKASWKFLKNKSIP